MGKDLPTGWVLDAEHRNSEGERIGIASYPGGHPDYGNSRLLVIWDDPPPTGTGILALTLLDLGAVEWLQDVIATIIESGQVQ